MKQFVIASLSVVLMASAVKAGDITLTWNFNSPTGALGTSQTYYSNPDNVAITAYGFTCSNADLSNCTTKDLYGKNDGVNENGLGLANGGDNEIQTNQFVQLDLTNLFKLLPLGETFTIDSVQLGEGFAFYQSNTQGVAGTLLSTYVGTGPTQVSQPLTLSAANGDFISVAAYGTGDVAIHSLSATIGSVDAPEPATLALVGGALIGLASLRRRKARS